MEITIEIKKPNWFTRKCQHEVVLVEENFRDRYGIHTSYMMCKKCGRTSSDIERTCKHEEDCFGVCRYCLTRLSKHDCRHDWTQEPNTDDWYCENCGKWQDD